MLCVLCGGSVLANCLPAQGAGSIRGRRKAGHPTPAGACKASGTGGQCGRPPGPHVPWGRALVTYFWWPGLPFAGRAICTQVRLCWGLGLKITVGPGPPGGGSQVVRSSPVPFSWLPSLAAPTLPPQGPGLSLPWTSLQAPIPPRDLPQPAPRTPVSCHRLRLCLLKGRAYPAIPKALCVRGGGEGGVWRQSPASAGGTPGLAPRCRVAGPGLASPGGGRMMTRGPPAPALHQQGRHVLGPRVELQHLLRLQCERECWGQAAGKRDTAPRGESELQPLGSPRRPRPPRPACRLRCQLPALLRRPSCVLLLLVFCTPALSSSHSWPHFCTEHVEADRDSERGAAGRKQAAALERNPKRRRRPPFPKPREVLRGSVRRPYGSGLAGLQAGGRAPSWVPRRKPGGPEIHMHPQRAAPLCGPPAGGGLAAGTGLLLPRLPALDLALLPLLLAAAWRWLGPRQPWWPRRPAGAP